MTENDIAFWRWPELKKRVPFGRTTIWKMCKDNRFPQPYKIGKTVIAWRSDEVLAWISERQRTA